MWNKKGANVMTGRAVKIILAVVGIVIVVTVVFAFMRFATQETIDEMCGIGNQVKEKLLFWPQMCERRSVDILPDNWEICPHYAVVYAEADDASGRAEAMRNCAIQQVAELVVRCWDFSGRGALGPGDYDCFQFASKNYPDGVNLDITMENLGTFMETNNVSGTDTPYDKKFPLSRLQWGGYTHEKGLWWRSYPSTGVINLNEVWLVEFNDDEEIFEGWDEDRVQFYSAEKVKVVDTKEVKCVRDPTCFEICGGVWGDGYSPNLGENCFVDAGCTLECINGSVATDDDNTMAEIEG
ncbi:MAG: hypothetical protein QF535_06615 [Anaerolineales bacterium]|jgi:hypothetical protein|nr:hypothetical protein [Anaerolineales bacterium]